VAGLAVRNHHAQLVLSTAQKVRVHVAERDNSS
jgi:hypothetical protein